MVDDEAGASTPAGSSARRSCSGLRMESQAPGSFLSGAPRFFLPGFSTAAAVTNVSGRGVGMDVVRTTRGGSAGSVDVESTVGCGTVLSGCASRLTLAIMPALTVACGSEGGTPCRRPTSLELVATRLREGATSVQSPSSTRHRSTGCAVSCSRWSSGCPRSLGTGEAPRPTGSGHQADRGTVSPTRRRFGLLVDHVLRHRGDRRQGAVAFG